MSETPPWGTPPDRVPEPDRLVLGSVVDGVWRPPRPLRPLAASVIGVAALWTVLVWVRCASAVAGDAPVAVLDGTLDVALRWTVAAAWLVTAVWLRQVYRVAAAFDRGRLRRDPVWVWLGWVVPIVELWFPKQVVDDAWTALSRLPGRRPKPRTGLWWAAWLVLTFVVSPEPMSTADAADLTPETTFWTAVATTVAFVLWVRVVHGLTVAHDGPPPSVGTAGTVLSSVDERGH